MADKLSATLCNRDVDCSWYHGFWQYLRLFGLASSPGRHGRFFRDALAPLNDRGVLVSGCADYGMLAQAVGACPESEISVVDICETPLHLCRWYAGKRARTVRTHRADILEWQASESFDAVCSHSFLSRFPGNRRPDLVSQWRRLLKPGGKVVTTTRINPSWTPEQSGFSPQQVRDFSDKVFREADSRADALGIDPEVLAVRGRIYAERSMNFSITSRDEIDDLFTKGGFGLGRLELTRIGGALGSSGPGTNQGGTYVEVVAVRA